MTFQKGNSKLELRTNTDWFWQMMEGSQSSRPFCWLKPVRHGLKSAGKMLSKWATSKTKTNCKIVYVQSCSSPSTYSLSTELECADTERDFECSTQDKHNKGEVLTTTGGGVKKRSLILFLYNWLWSWNLFSLQVGILGWVDKKRED